MALVAFLRGINVGGHRAFRPSVLAQRLADHGVVNVGAAGTFVVRRPGARTSFEAKLRRLIPFDADVAFCDGRELRRLVANGPFAGKRDRPDIVRFVSVLRSATRRRIALPMEIPSDGSWLVRVRGRQGRLLFGEYRRTMKTIGALGRLDTIFGTPAITRSWSTIEMVVRLLTPDTHE